MYNITYICRYYNDDLFMETDNITDDEKDYVRDIIYKEDLLHVFDIVDCDDINIFNLVISELYDNLASSEELKECMRITASKLISEDEQLGLCILYSYDFMYLTHKCVSSFLENGTILPQYLKELKEKLI